MSRYDSIFGIRPYLDGGFGGGGGGGGLEGGAEGLDPPPGCEGWLEGGGGLAALFPIIVSILSLKEFNKNYRVRVDQNTVYSRHWGFIIVVI